jgi:hypothetical protein
MEQSSTQKSPVVNVNGNEAESETVSTRICTIEDHIKACNIDRSIWELDNFKTNTWETHAVVKGKFQSVVNFQIKAVWKRKVFIPVSFEPIKTVSFSIHGLTKPKKPAKKQFETSMILSDSQIGYKRNFKTGMLSSLHDRRVFILFLDILRDVQPDKVFFLGDIFDCTEWTDKYIVSPEFCQTFQPALIEFGYMIGLMRQASPGTKFVYLKGNHEERIIRSIKKNLPAAYGLRTVLDESANKHISDVLSIPYLLGFDLLGIEYHDSYPESHYWINEDLRISHGVLAGTDITKKLSKESVYSEIVGHVHKVESVARTVHVANGKTKTITTTSVGCACKIDNSVPAVRDRMNWQQGFCLSYTTKDWHQIHNLLVNQGSVVVNNRQYVAGKSDLVEYEKNLVKETHWEIFKEENR